MRDPGEAVAAAGLPSGVGVDFLELSAGRGGTSGGACTAASARELIQAAAPGDTQTASA